MTELKEQLHLALHAAIANTKLPFIVYDDLMFEEEPRAGEWLTMTETYNSEYAITLKLVHGVKPVETLGGMRNQKYTEVHIYHPFYEEGDASVGMDGGWIVDFVEEEPNFVTESVVEAAMHCANYFLNNNMRYAINNALEADFWQKEKARRLSEEQL